MQETDVRLLVAAAKADPSATLRQAEALRSGETRDVNAMALLDWVRGVATFELGRNDEAVALLTAALETAPSDDDRHRIEVSLAAAQAAAGDRDTAATRLRRLTESPNRELQAIAKSQLGYVELHNGNLHASRKLLEEALELVTVDDVDPSDSVIAAQARILGNLGHCLIALGDLYESWPYHRAALNGARATGQSTVEAGSLQNLGYTEMKLGNLPRAIELLDEAEAVYRSIGAPARNLATLFDDMAETYRFAGLTSEALSYAALATETTDRGSNLERQADAKLRAARCNLDHGNPTEARNLARSAEASFEAAGRRVLALRARVIALEASVRLNDDGDAISPDEIASAIDLLTTSGWSGDAAALANLAASRLIAIGDPEAAATVLNHDVEVGDGLADQLEARFGEALRSLSSGTDAREPIEAARQLIWAHRGLLADPELRAGAHRLAERFRRLDIKRATTEPPSALIDTEERWRVIANEVTVPKPIVVSPVFDELRSSAERCATAATLTAAVRRLGQRAHRLSHAALAPSVHGSAAIPAAATVGDLKSKLAMRLVIHLVRTDDGLIGSAIRSSGVEAQWHCGSDADTGARIDDVRRLLRRLVRSHLTPIAENRFAHELRRISTSLGSRLFGPTPPGRDDDVIVVPPADLLDLPWSLLVPEPQTAITIAPSLARLRSRAPEPLTGPGVVITGPGLDSGTADRDSFVSAFPNATSVCGDAANRSMFRSTFETADVVHIAAHGTFRADSPMFSSFMLADGPVHLYDLHDLHGANVAPRLVVIAACEGGRISAPVDAAPLGPAIALLSLGCECVIAPVAAVEDGRLAETMRNFYTALPGRPPHAALAAVRRAVSAKDARSWAVAHSIQSMGTTPPSAP